MKAHPVRFAFPLLLISVMLFMVGCSVYQKKRRDPECKGLFDQIKNGWVRDSSTGLYGLSAELIAAKKFGYFHDDACLMGISARDAERLFGKPDTAAVGAMFYYMTPPCLGSGGANANNCSCMMIRFDNEGGLKRILFGTSLVTFN